MLNGAECSSSRVVAVHPPRNLPAIMAMLLRQNCQVFSETYPDLCDHFGDETQSVLSSSESGVPHGHVSDSIATVSWGDHVGDESQSVLSACASGVPHGHEIDPIATVSFDDCLLAIFADAGSPGTGASSSAAGSPASTPSRSKIAFPETDLAVVGTARQSLMASLLLTSEDSLSEPEDSLERQVFVDFREAIEEPEDSPERQRSRSPRVPTRNMAIELAIAREVAKTQQYWQLIWALKDSTEGVLEFAEELLASSLKTCSHIKFGLTAGVKERFFEYHDSAHFLDWGKMYIVRAAFGDECAALEKLLIRTFQENDKVQNILRGGEGARPETPSFVYILANNLDEVVFFGSRRMRARAKARRGY